MSKAVSNTDLVAYTSAKEVDSHLRLLAAASPHFSPGFVSRAARRHVQWGFRSEGRGGVLDSTSSTPRRENTAGRGASPAVAESW